MNTDADLDRLVKEIDDAEAAQHASRGYIHERDHVIVNERRDFYAIDIGTSGAWMVRKADGAIFGIKGYGTPDYRKGIGYVGSVPGSLVHSMRWQRGPFRTDMKEVRL